MAGVNGGSLNRSTFAEGTIMITASMDPQAKRAITDFLGSLNQIVKGDKIGPYFDSLSNVTSKFAASLQRFKKDTGNFDFAKSLVNDFNALEGIAQSDGKKIQDVLKGVAGGYDNVMQSVIRAREVAGSSSFDGITAKAVQDFVTSGRIIEEWGADVNKIIEGVTLNTSTEELQQRIRELNETLAVSNTEKDKAAAASERYKKAAEQAAESERRLREVYNEKFHGDEYQELVNKAEKYNEVVQRNVEEVQRFIEISKLGTFDSWGSLDQSVDYSGIQTILDSVEHGSMNASEAIVRLKEEYGSLIDLSNTGDIGESKIAHLESAIQETVSIVRELKDSVGNAGFGSSDGNTVLDRALGNSEEIRGDTEALRAAQTVVVNFLNSLVSDTSGIATEQTTISGLVAGLKELASVDVQGLTLTSDILRRLPTMAKVEVDTAQMDNLIGALKSLSQLSKDMDLTALTPLTNVNLSGFNGLSVSKASLSNLATYLPVITGSGVDIDKLRALSQISLANLNKENLSVSKASFEHLRELIQTIQGVPNTPVSSPNLSGMDNAAQSVDQVIQKVAQEKDVFREADAELKQHVASVESATKAEAEKAKAADDLTAAMARETEAIDKAAQAADRHKSALGTLEDSNSKEDARMQRLAAAEAEYYAKQERMRAEAEAKKQKQIDDEVAKHNAALAKEEEAIEAATRREIEMWERAEEKKLASIEKTAAAAVAAEQKAAESAQRVSYNDARSRINNYYDLLKQKDTNAAKREDVVMTEAGWASQSGVYAELAKQLNDATAAYNMLTDAQNKNNYSNEQIAALNELNATRQKDYALAVENTAAKEAEHAQKSAELAQKKQEEAEAARAAKEAKQQEAEATKAQTQAEKDAAKRTKEKITEDNQKAALLKKLNGLYTQCTGALQKYAVASKLAGNKEAYDGIKSTRDAVSELIKELNVAEPDLAGIAKRVQEADGKFSIFSTTLKTNGGVLNNWLVNGASQLQSRLQYSLGLAAMLYKAVGEVKKMVTTAVELDSAMNTLQIVTRASGAEMDEYGKRVSSMAKETAQATKDLIDATTVYARLGYSMDESSILSKYTAMLQSVGDIDASSAQNAITAIIKAFSKGVNDIEDVMDKMVLVGNNFPISVSQIAEGMNNAGSMLNVAGNSFEESIALLTAANSTIQNISKASTGLRTIAARIRKTTTGEDDEGEIVEEAKYQEMINALTKHRVSLIDAETKQYRSTYEIIKDIAGVWGEMTSMEQAAVVEALAGTRQQNIFASLMTQFSTAEDAVEQMKDSAGELQEAYNIRMESIQAHINQLKAAFDELSMKVVNSDLAKGAIDIVTKIIEGLTSLIDKIGGVGVALAALGGIAAVKFLAGGGIAGLILDISKLAITIGNIISLLPQLAIVSGVIAAVIGLVAGIKSLKKAYDEAHPSFELSKKLLAETGKTIDDLTSKIDTNNQRIHALEEAYKNGDFTVVEEAELTRLEVENQLLEAQLELQKKIQAERQKQVHEAAVSTANTLLGNNSEENPFAQTIQNAIDNYKQAQKDLEAAKEYLVKRGEDATKNDQTYVDVAMYNLEQRSAELNNVLNKIAEVTAELDPEEDKDLIDDLTEAVADFTKTLDGTSKKTKKWREDLKALEKVYGSNLDALKRLARGEELTRAEGERLRRWMHDCGYDAKELAELLSQMSEELFEEQDETEEGNGYLDAQISKWGTMSDEIERAKKAIDDYNNAMSGGNNGDMAAQMEEAWKKAVEDIDSGRIDSRAVWAFAEMAMTPQQLAELEFDAARIAEAIKGSFYQEMFKDEENDDGYSYGQRLLFQLEKDLDHLNGVNVWEDDTGLHYWIEDFAALADQLNVSEGFLDAFLDDLDAYGSQLLTDTKQNTELINTFLDIKDKATDAREAMKEFIAVSFNNDKDMSDLTMARILTSLHDQGFLDIDPSEYYKVIGEVREENEKLEEDNPVVTPELNDQPLVDDINNMMSNIQSFLNNNPLTVSIGGYYTNSTDTGSTEEHFGDSKVSNKPISMSGHYTKSSAIGKRPGQDGGDTLVNELGPELISDNGRAFIANGGKPGFVRLSDNAIVFTANETKDILKGKRNVNAKAYASGNVGRGSLVDRLVHGSVNARAYIRCPVCGTANPDSRSSCYSCGASLHGGSAASVNNSRGTTGSSNAGVNRSAYGSPTAVTTGQNMGGNGYYYNPTTQTITYTTYTYDDSSGLGYGTVNDYKYYESMYQAAQRAQEKLEAELYKAKHKAQQDANRQQRADFLANGANKLSGSGGGNYVGGSDYSSSNPQKVDWIAVRINRIQRTIADLEKVASSGFKKLDLRLTKTKDQIQKTTEEIGVMNSAYDRYIQEANNVGLSSSIAGKIKDGTIDINEYDDDTREKIDEYTEW